MSLFGTPFNTICQHNGREKSRARLYTIMGLWGYPFSEQLTLNPRRVALIWTLSKPP